MTDTTTRLPVDWAGLKLCLPPEPQDTTAARLLLAIQRLDEIISHTLSQIDEADRADRAAAAELVDQAVNGASLEPLARLNLDVRRSVERRLDMLRSARALGAVKHTEAQQTDPALVKWRERCRAIEHEWQNILAVDDEQRRFSELADFAARYAQTVR